jgi:ParB family chromosome partitioning protein
LKKLEEGLMGRLGVKVQVQHSARGAGKLVLKYKNLDELDGLLERLEYKEV